jgi:hypothetical protein
MGRDGATPPDLAARHPTSGPGATSALFGIVELVRDRETYHTGAVQRPSDEMKAVAKSLRDQGLYTFVRWHTIMNNPP